MPDTILISWLVWISVILMFAGFVPMIVGFARKRKFYKNNPTGYFARKFSFTAHILFVTLGVLLAVFLSRYAVAYYSSFAGKVPVPCDDIGKLEYGGKEWINSFLHALQTFSMDEDYTEYWRNGQAMIRYATDNDRMAEICYNVYMGILNFFAPILGGAIVFEMLIKISPTVRLWCSNLNIWKEKYYFSELNENSLALARSILSDPSRRNATLVFTDAYADDEEEESTEWLLEAKSMGAICLKADLLHIFFNKRNIKGLHVFLIDKEENNNTGVLAAMFDDRNIRIYQKARIYVFSTDRKYSCIEDEVKNIVNLERSRLDELNKNLEKKISMPYVFPVNIGRNMADTLMQELPLFEPLIGSAQKELTVTIVGGGSIGTEMFLAAYRFGQILDVRLNINVVSKEAEHSDDNDNLGFSDRINFINPEILRSARMRDELLIYNCDESHPEWSEPYMEYRYISANVMSDNFIGLFENDEKLLNTDYFIIALGNDEDNFMMADRVKCIIGQYHLVRAPERKTVIAYSIYNSQLSGKLNELGMRKYVNNGKKDCDIFMYAFGGRDEVYSCDNVFFEGIKYSAYLTGKAYEEHTVMTPEQARLSNEEALKKKYKEMLKDIYNHISSLARSMHLKYKIFSSGNYRLNDGTYMSVFHEDYDPSHKDDYSRQRLERYKEHIVHIDLSTDEKYRENSKILHRLAWLEHRRWCAFMRTCGFRSVSLEDMKKFYTLGSFEHKKKDHKFIPLKWHPCLVECSENGILIGLDENGKAAEGYHEGFDANAVSDYSCVNSGKFDKLDRLSYYNRSLKEAGEYCYDFKKWDYPSEEKIDDRIYTND